ncbi:hypothetical protein C8J57DRAFT_1469803 [Mycena rebaudengoi]|nr:hypothetical protein C8J57DRAFT_1469803 [Mycena rebaudengoi]
MLALKWEGCDSQSWMPKPDLARERESSETCVRRGSQDRMRGKFSDVRRFRKEGVEMRTFGEALVEERGDAAPAKKWTGGQRTSPQRVCVISRLLRSMNGMFNETLHKTVELDERFRQVVTTLVMLFKYGSTDGRKATQAPPSAAGDHRKCEIQFMSARMSAGSISRKHPRARPLDETPLTHADVLSMARFMRFHDVPPRRPAICSRDDEGKNERMGECREAGRRGKRRRKQKDDACPLNKTPARTSLGVAPSVRADVLSVTCPRAGEPSAPRKTYERAAEQSEATARGRGEIEEIEIGRLRRREDARAKGRGRGRGQDEGGEEGDSKTREGVDGRAGGLIRTERRGGREWNGWSRREEGEGKDEKDCEIIIQSNQAAAHGGARRGKKGRKQESCRLGRRRRRNAKASCPGRERRTCLVGRSKRKKGTKEPQMPGVPRSAKSELREVNALQEGRNNQTNVGPPQGQRPRACPAAHMRRPTRPGGIERDGTTEEGAGRGAGTRDGRGSRYQCLTRQIQNPRVPQGQKRAEKTSAGNNQAYEHKKNKGQVCQRTGTSRKSCQVRQMCSQGRERGATNRIGEQRRKGGIGKEGWRIEEGRRKVKGERRRNEERMGREWQRLDAQSGSFPSVGISQDESPRNGGLEEKQGRVKEERSMSMTTTSQAILTATPQRTSTSAPSSARPGLHRREVQCGGFKQKDGPRMRSFRSGGSQSIQSKCVTAGLCWKELRIRVWTRRRGDSIKRDSKAGSGEAGRRWEKCNGCVTMVGRENPAETTAPAGIFRSVSCAQRRDPELTLYEYQGDDGLNRDYRPTVTLRLRYMKAIRPAPFLATANPCLSQAMFFPPWATLPPIAELGLNSDQHSPVVRATFCSSGTSSMHSQLADDILDLRGANLSERLVSLTKLSLGAAHYSDWCKIGVIGELVRQSPQQY